ncbi:MAG: S41 family peptidase [Prevotellaceae bacterium]|jgi:carboxyl-terminal processing protease|nr:S41 family peptidase [Prevotellaceae bacterium]
MRKTIFFVSLLFILPCSAGAQSDEFNTIKSTDIYFSILRELSLYYVDSVQVGKLVDASIHAMLEQLDPYTEYVPEEAAEAFDFVITGRYGGIGAIIRKIDGGVQISDPYEGYPADKAGLVPGDCILEIDGQSLKSVDTQTASSRLKGLAGSALSLKVRKLKTGDTLDLRLTREHIHIPDIHYHCLLKDSIGYINLNAFTKDGSRDFIKTFLALKKTGKMKSLILDLRSNGGGSLDEAVNTVGAFVPRGTTVVEARGRLKDFEAKYMTRENPLDTAIPIVVLVNSMSASSSEIVAGALQDFDRAVIVGTRTFGKGLVQSVRDLGYNAKLKITTAKYYTPSGRCVQIVDYSHRRDDGSVGVIPDSLIKAFKTRNGRTVYDGGGITPDVAVEPPAYHKISYSIAARDLLREYALTYFVAHAAIAPPETFRLTDVEYDDFVKYLLNKDFNDEPDVFTQQKPELKELLEGEICTLYYYQQGRLRNKLPRDNQVDKAIEVLSNPVAYKKILAN